MKLRKIKQVWMTVVLLATLLMSSSCTIGTKTKTKVVYVGFGSPSAHKGKLKIATNKKIEVTVGQDLVELDLGGYIAVKESDLDKLIDEVLKHDTKTTR